MAETKLGTAKLILEGKEYEFPTFVGTEGEKAIDITKLRQLSEYVTYDPGYGNTGCTKSVITFIDGEKGILHYRGIPIEEMAERSTFVETAWHLIFGRLPKKSELDRFSGLLTKHAPLNEEMKHHFQGFPQTAPPMAVLSAMINTMSCFHPHMFSLEEEGKFEEAAAMLISKVRTISAYSYRSTMGLPYMYPNPKLKYCGNFLHMMFSKPYAEIEVDPDVEAALNMILILHADHEQNCSTSTVRVVGSSQANLFASCAAGVCALWGPLHGGANVAVLEMLDQIKEGSLTPKQYMEKAKDKNSNIRLMGFGHRVYKNYDPRARFLKKHCDIVLNKLGVKDPLLDIARELEELALSDSYFVDRKLYPNVDFYSGIIMRAIGIPINMFTVMFAIGRMPGWIAQYKEQHDDVTGRISRPRQVYTGQVAQHYVPVEKRA